MDIFSEYFLLALKRTFDSKKAKSLSF